MWRGKNIYFTEHDIYFTKLMFILKNINLELKSALRTKYIFYRILLYYVLVISIFIFIFILNPAPCMYFSTRHLFEDGTMCW